MKLSYDRTRGETCPPKEFLKKANKVYNFKYDYSKTHYVNSHTKIIIICKKHGLFYKTPNNHLRGQGCKKCIHEKLRSERQRPLKDFIKRCQKIHKNKYSYEKVKYINCDTKIEITCLKHGSFFQEPFNHLNNKQGCMKCYRERNVGCTHAHWNPNLSEQDRLDKRRTYVLGYNQWKKDVLKRDNYQCQITGCRSNLHIHHIIPWSKNKEKRMVISNGVTITATLHKLFHKIYGYDNNETQFKEFILSLK